MATREHPTHVSYVLCVEVLQIQRRQRPATIEHRAHISYVLCVEVLQIERSQCRAIFKHPTHVSDVPCIEVPQVNRSQCLASGEHEAHVGYVLCIEALQVERRQRLASGEHAPHVFHLRSVEVFQSFYFRESFTMIEPRGGGGGTEISERRIEHHTCGGIVYHLPCSCPCGVGSLSLLLVGSLSLLLHLPNPPCRAGASGAQCIVIEGERRLVRTLCHIGLAGLRLRTQRSGEQETK